MKNSVKLVLRSMLAAPLAGLAVCFHYLMLGCNHLSRKMLGQITHVPLAQFEDLVNRFDELSAKYDALVAKEKVAKKGKK